MEAVVDRVYTTALAHQHIVSQLGSHVPLPLTTITAADIGQIPRFAYTKSYD